MLEYLGRLHVMTMGNLFTFDVLLSPVGRIWYWPKLGSLAKTGKSACISKALQFVYSRFRGWRNGN